jgi:type II secretory pathway component PulF
MPVFTFRGTNRSGATVTGEQTAASKAELANTLRRQQINVTKMSE